MRKVLVIHILCAFLANTFGPLPRAQADDFPAPGVMVHLSPPFSPPMLKGIKVHSENPFRFDFILDVGADLVSARKTGGDKLLSYKQEATKLIKYFLASLTIPEKDLWVNLSPYEKDRIIPNSFGLTEMGRDLLAEDYMLKQITASLIYPEDEVGKKFWKRIYEEAEKKFGTTNVPVNTFNKVWIVPEQAVVYENVKAGTAYVVEAKLKVMLEEDYLSLQKHNHSMPSPNVSIGDPENATSRFPIKAFGNDNNINTLGSQIIREIVIPQLTKEVNENKNFAQLRQVYNSLILATWYKKRIKDSLLAQVYADKNKTIGLSSPNIFIGDPEYIYQQYLKAFKKGVYNYIKEEQDPLNQQPIPRKYFSGGMNVTAVATDISVVGAVPSRAMVAADCAMEVDVNLTTAKASDKPLIVRKAALDSAQVAHPVSRFQNGRVEVYHDQSDVAKRIARQMADILIANNEQGKSTVMICPTGGTAEPIYVEFLRIVGEEDIRLERLITFNMDEYYVGPNYPGKWAENPQSYRYYMEKYLFRELRRLNLGWNDNNVHFLDGQASDIQEEIKRYEREFSQMKHEHGIAFALGGIGGDGHVAFNEPVIEVISADRIAPAKIIDFNEFWVKTGKENWVKTISRLLTAHWTFRRANNFTSYLEKKFLENNIRVDNQSLEALANKLEKQKVTIYLDGLKPSDIGHLKYQLKDIFERFGVLQQSYSSSVEFVDSRTIFEARTRYVQLAIQTIVANARFFKKKEIGEIPVEALTIGPGTLMDAKEIVIAATGGKKSEAVYRAVVLSPSSEVSASFLQEHPKVTFVVDKDAGGLLGNTDAAAEAGAGAPVVRNPPSTRAADRAQLAKKGGIDLTRANKYLQIKNNGGGIKFYLDSAQLTRLQNAPGFAPVIINMHPLKNPQEFLGISVSSSV